MKEHCAAKSVMHQCVNRAQSCRHCQGRLPQFHKKQMNAVLSTSASQKPRHTPKNYVIEFLKRTISRKILLLPFGVSNLLYSTEWKTSLFMFIIVRPVHISHNAPGLALRPVLNIEPYHKTVGIVSTEQSIHLERQITPCRQTHINPFLHWTAASLLVSASSKL